MHNVSTSNPQVLENPYKSECLIRPDPLTKMLFPSSVNWLSLRWKY